MKKRIPTNLITGFLGTGKTTAILHLLQQKPEHEKWAVLVNEFGEVGIDGALLANRGAEIREVAGGCMCCVADLPMQVALNTLIARARPDRLLIETTGLGHPQALIDNLTDDYYSTLLELRAVVCLVDPRKLAEARYRDHSIFRDQLAIADVIGANKTDLCGTQDKVLFEQFIARQSQRTLRSGWIRHGELPKEWLDIPHGGQRLVPRVPKPKTGFLRQPAKLPEPIALQPGEYFARRENTGDGYYGCGWQFAEHVVFDYQRLMKLLLGLPVARLKGLLNTNQGGCVFNDNDGVLTIGSVTGRIDNIIEMIHDERADWLLIERQLLAAQSDRG